ncbi:MAG: NAD(P)/FAD-dependent oxidoreductase [Gammaproteobacteria bacterium]
MLRNAHWDAAIVGGGPAGSAAACRLARAGKKVLLIEKEKYPHHKVCGEFLSFEAQRYLFELDVDAVGLGATLLRSVRLHYGRCAAHACLPFTGLGLSRFLLDEQLLARAADHGAQVRRGCKVTRIAPAGGRWRLEAVGLDAIETDAVFLATGKHELRGRKRPTGAQNGFIGLKMHFMSTARQRRALADRVDIILFDGGYAGLQLIEDGKANLCLVVTKRRFAQIGKDWRRLLAYIARACPYLHDFLDRATPCWRQPAAIAALPYGFVHADSGARADGIYRLGDQFAVIPSFSGEGVSIALHTARLAADEFIAGGQRASAFHERARAELYPQIHMASLLGRALERPAVQGLGIAACRLFPALVSGVAARTRLRAFA